MAVQNIVIMKYFILFCLFANAFLKTHSQSSKIPTIALADSFYYDRNWKQAAQIYEQALHDTSSDPLPWCRLGFSYYNVGNNNGAMKAYQKSSMLNPSGVLKPVLFSRMARSFAKAKKYDEALSALNVASEAGYANPDELDSLAEFDAIRSQEKFRHTPVIMFTSSENEQDIKKSYENGANAYLVKPDNLKSLHNVIEDTFNFWLKHNVA